MSLSEAMKNMRFKALLSQEVLAKELHVSVGTINRWENGKALPNITAMKHIKEFCIANELPYEDIESEWLDAKEN
ncbi:MAG: helix-turn-helix transcriptional regulator [Eubacteriaceae bacterium]|nr:helix-turn-helix transcriptional regulator [Eubacteriaceae bacterium]